MNRKQIYVKTWCIQNNCSPGDPIYPFWEQNMKKWDNDFKGYYGGGTYDEGVLDTQLQYTKEKLQK